MQYNNIGIALNTLAREQMKYKLMADGERRTDG